MTIDIDTNNMYYVSLFAIPDAKCGNELEFLFCRRTETTPQSIDC